MELTVLVDNNTLIDRYFYGEPAVSYFIEDCGKKILFDVGYSDVFIRNAVKMNIDLLNLDYVVLSHGHLDHTWGLDPLIRLYTEAGIEDLSHRRPTVIAHPLTFMSKEIGGWKEIGSLIPEEKLSKHFKTRLSREPVWLTNKLVYLGEIERKNDFEAETPVGLVMGEEDYVMDDSALAYKTPGGLVVISSCAHAGICNTIDYAKKVCGVDEVIDVLGGFHLLNPPEKQMQKTLKYMENLQPTEVHACHCTDLNSKIALSGVVNLKEVGVGLRLRYK